MGDRPITSFFTVKPSTSRKRALETSNFNGPSKRLKGKKNSKQTNSRSALSLERAPDIPPCRLQPEPRLSNVRRAEVHDLPLPQPSAKSSLSHEKAFPFLQDKRLDPKSTSTSSVYSRNIMNDKPLSSSSTSLPSRSLGTRTHTYVALSSSQAHNRLSETLDEGIVPSSQSQYEFDHLRSPFDEDPETLQQAKSLPNPWDSEFSARSISPRINEDEDLVLSSQTQLVEYLIHSPRKLGHDKDIDVSSQGNINSSEIIPSSQPHEMEFISSNGNTLREHFWRPFGNEDDSKSKETMKSITQGNLAHDVIAEAVSIYVSGDELLTESETEDEHSNNIHTLRMHVDHPTEGISDEISPIFQRRGASHRPERSPVVTVPVELPQSSSNSDSLGSLPLVLKEFQDMFDDSEDSFPPDFPMSLRS